MALSLLMTILCSRACAEGGHPYTIGHGLQKAGKSEFVDFETVEGLEEKV